MRQVIKKAVKFWVAYAINIPDFLTRWFIRNLTRSRLKEQADLDPAVLQKQKKEFIKKLSTAPLALEADQANAQHYEVPAQFFKRVLGPHLKYSSCYYPTGSETLSDAEEAMLGLSVERAQVQDGQSILELGCGWGSLSLYLARHFPHCHITSVGNSRLQKAYIDAEIEREGFRNLNIRCEDMNHFHTDESFDRILSIEMFEHMRNWPELFRRVHSWLKPQGEFFLHFFSHRKFAYPFEVRDITDWMAEHFFSGGIMPSHDLPQMIDHPFEFLEDWWLDGTHYQKTSEAWLSNMDDHEKEILALFKAHYGADSYRRWHMYWRVFFMACSEVFGFASGQEWGVSHYRFRKNEESALPKS